jgi:hypothetical protein
MRSFALLWPLARVDTSPRPRAPDNDQHPAPMSTPESNDADRSTFRQNLIRVMTVQVVTLVLLWLLQARYTG